MRGFEKAEAISLLSLEILNEIASSFASLTPRNDGDFDGILDEILDEIASSLASLNPRNYGIIEF
ncbi:MAG: hypothetical protein MR481_00720 [Campylobacter sp.]|uniref:hypothetical protein n=1 Tax=Campylobacter sp. TaxID=205 RepID=UPI002AA6E255|nr:hypothetical protein [Campylobacter sp.]MCI7246439.1 hypothetical protein [Campylobacter sp.]